MKCVFALARLINASFQYAFIADITLASVQMLQICKKKLKKQKQRHTLEKQQQQGRRQNLHIAYDTEEFPSF